MVTLAVVFMVCPWDSQRLSNVEGIIWQLQREGGCRGIYVAYAMRGKTTWQTAKAAWVLGLRSGASHVVVVQDDVRVCRDFVAGVKKVVESRPLDIIGLFSMRTIGGESHWVDIRYGVWGQAIVMPRELVGKFLTWEAKSCRTECPHDDRRVQFFAMAKKIPTMLTIPNLVDHLPWQSMMGHGGGSRASKHFIGSGSPLDIDWVKDANNPTKLAINYSLGVKSAVVWNAEVL